MDVTRQPLTFCGVCSYPLKQSLRRIALDGIPHEQRKAALGASSWHATLADFCASVHRGCQVCATLRDLITDLNGCDGASLEGVKNFKLIWRLGTDGSLGCLFETDERPVHHEFELFIPSLCLQNGKALIMILRVKPVSDDLV
jgi:hypothetical protein